MCTVSFIANKNEVIITSNRDEHISRPAPLYIQEDAIEDLNIYYPADPTAGGTWYAIKDNATLVILLNGAFEKHVRKPKYKKSRGLIVLEIVKALQPIAHLKSIDLEGVEPFTVIVFNNTNLVEMRWDEIEKHISVLNSNQAYIWSSSTLYSKMHREHRAKLFESFIKKYPNPTAKQIQNFHLNNEGDSENGFVIDRETGLKTVSITQTVVTDNKMQFQYQDLQNSTKHQKDISVKASLQLK